MRGPSFQSMKSDVNEIRGYLQAPGHFLRADCRVRDAVLPKDSEDFFVHPRWIAELDGVAKLRPSQRSDEIAQTREILFQRTRKLPKERAAGFT
jgi:hypothetical protein